MYVCMYVCIYKYMYVCIYIYTYTDTTGQSGHRVSRPWGTGSEGDSVGEGHIEERARERKGVGESGER